MAVYLDLVMILNFLVDFLLFLGTNRLSGFPPEPWRCALGALLGSLYSGASMLPGFRFLGRGVWPAVWLAVCAMAAYGINRSALKRGAVFVLLSMALGGIALSLGRGDFLTLVLAAGGLWLLCRFSFGEGVGEREYVNLSLSYEGRQVNMIALRDSGNTLTDPITGQPVLVISGEAAQRLTGLTPEQLSHPLETLASGCIRGLRLIPYRAIGQGSGMLLGMRLDNVTVGKKKQSTVVAFAQEGLGSGSMYQALTGGVI